MPSVRAGQLRTYMAVSSLKRCHEVPAHYLVVRRACAAPEPGSWHVLASKASDHLIDDIDLVCLAAVIWRKTAIAGDELLSLPDGAASRNDHDGRRRRRGPWSSNET